MTGQIKTIDDLPADDPRRMFTRFGEEYIKHNLALVHSLEAIAAKKGYTPGQLSIAWVGSLGAHVVPLPGSSYVALDALSFGEDTDSCLYRKKERTLENLASGDIELTAADLAEINGVIAKHEIKGDRYFGNADAAHLWG